MPRILWLSFVFVCLTVAVPAGTLAQMTNGSIVGTIRDDTRAVLPGVTVTAKNVETGLTRTIVTDERGLYRMPALPVGPYEVTATLPGFRTAVRSGLTLAIGEEVVVDLVLALGEIAEEVVVSGEGQLIQTTSATVSSVVDEVSMRALPLNARDFAQLATFQSGVFPIPSAGSGGHVNRAARITVAGAQMASNRFNLDGTEINDRFNQTPGSVAGVMLGVEAVREFSIQSSIYKAEHGAAGGAVVNMVTRSGTNKIQGSLLNFHRNDALDAKNFFATVKPPFVRNQFGAALGGPIARDRTFFFGNYEGLRERLGLIRIANVPDEAARRGFLPDATGNLRFIGPVSPAIQPVLNFYPLPNGASRGQGVAELISNATQPLREDYMMGRVDHHLSNTHSVFGRYTISDANFTNPFGGSAVPGFPLKRTSRNQYTTLEGNSVLSSILVNTVRIGFARANSEAFGTEKYDTLVLIPGRQNANISPGNGVTALGDSSTTPSQAITNVFDVYDDVTISKGRHTFKLGSNLKYRQTNVHVDFRSNGQYTWASLEDFLLNRPAREFIGTTPESSTRRYYRTTFLALYAQDDVRLGNALTLNVGVRYEVQRNPIEKFGRISFVDDIRTAAGPSTDDHIYDKNPGLLNLAPRIGFAWDVGASGKMAVRGGFGLFYDHIESNLFADSTNAAPFVITSRVFDPVFPATFNANATNEILTREMARSIHTPHAIRWNLNIQREVLPTVMAEIGYTGSRGVQGPYAIDLNPYVPTSFVEPGKPFYAPGVRPQRVNPLLGELRSRQTGAQSFFHGVDLSLRKRFSDGMQFSASYSFGKAIDEASGAVGADFAGTSRFQVENPFDRRYMRGPASFDMRQKLSVTALFELPVGAGRHYPLQGFADAVFGGWNLSTMVMVTSGNPRTISATGDIARGVTVLSHLRPDLVSGADNNPIDPGNPNQYIDPSAFAAPAQGRFGDLGANTVTTPGLATVDLGIVKILRVRATEFELRWEVFNALNRANFGLPATQLFSRRADAIVPTAGFGRITSTTTEARQMQVGVKVRF